MLYRPSISKKSSRFVAFAAAASLLAAAAPSYGQDIKPTPVASTSQPITTTTNCRDFVTSKEIFGDAKCEVIRGELLDAQSKALDAQNTMAERELACLKQILTAAKNKKINLTAVPPQGQACQAAKGFGLS